MDRGVNPLLQFGGGGRRLWLLSSRLRCVAAEVEGVAAFGGEVDFGDEAGLAHGVGPRFPAVAAALGGFFVVTGDGGVGRVVAVPDVPAGGGYDGQRGAVHPLNQERCVDRDVGLEGRREVEGSVPDAGRGGDGQLSVEA